MRREQSNIELLQELNEMVAGHEEAKKALIVMLGRSILRTHQKYTKYMDNENLISPLKILLVGPSGHGKTYLIECLQKLSMFPIVKLDATHLNPVGAGGGVKPADIIKEIEETATWHAQNFPQLFKSVYEAVERTVVFVDELDKLGNSFDGGSATWNKHVQATFLTLFDNKEQLAGVSFVFAGAFTDITKKEVKKNSIGFNKQDDNCKEEKFLDERVISTGLIPELVGRINTIIELEHFTEEQMYTILTERVIPKKSRDLAAYGIFDKIIDECVLRDIAKKASTSGQGVRHLTREIDKIYLDAEFDSDNDVKLLESFAW